MNSRERVLTAAECSLPDRLPIFSPNIMRTSDPYDPGLEQFLDSFGFDTLSALSGVRDHPQNQKDLGNGMSEDGYGCVFEYKGVGLPYCTHSPLAHADSVAEVEAYQWPDPGQLGAIAPDAEERARAARETGDYATSVGVAHLFHQYHYLRGFEQWMVDIKLNEGIFRAIADRIYHINSTLVMRLLEKIGPYTDVVSLNDDMGTSIAPYMSPEDFKTHIKPYYRDLISLIKTGYPHVKVYLHSHGQIMDLVPDLIDCGVDILNPVLPLDNMDAKVLKREYGQDLCFHGGVDIESIVPFGTVEDVRRHVREVIDTFAPGGGYWFKLQVISPVIPPGNIIAAYETALTYG